MFLSKILLTRGSALTATMVLAGIAANAGATTPVRDTARPAAVHPAAATAVPYPEQVLGEGGTLAANYDGNLADIVGQPIPCATPGFDRDCASESSIPAKPVDKIQVLYAAIGTGGAQLDFVDEQSGKAAKSASTYPLFADTYDAYVGTSGYSPYAGASPEPTGPPEDTLDFAAGDAPIPLGPKEGNDFVPKGFTIYADSIAAFDNGGSTSGSDQTGAGYNPNRGPAKVVPVIATGVSIIVNTTGFTNPSAPLNLTQDDLCGIMTGQYTDWNQTAAAPTGTTSDPITIVHRSDGSGTTFLTAYDLSQMCSAANPIYGTAGAPKTAEFWGQSGGLSQGVGTDSSVFPSSTNNTPPTDGTAPEVVWPYNSLGESKTGGVIAGVAATTGGIGYVSPSNTLGANTIEAYVQNYGGNYEQATGTTVAAAFAGTTSGDANPPGYPVDNKTTTLYFPFPTASTGDALVGYSYGYFYTCYPTRLKDQATGIKDFFGYETATKTAPTAATVAAFWNLNALSTAQAKELTSALSFKTAAVTKGTSYISPVNGAKEDYTCTDT